MANVACLELEPQLRGKLSLQVAFLHWGNIALVAERAHQDVMDHEVRGIDADTAAFRFASQLFTQFKYFGNAQK
jgi:hypothetical protein